MRKTFLLFIVGLLIPACLRAQIVITEVMYDVDGTDSGREWIEIRNDSQDSMDISSWKLFEAGINHKLAPIGSSVIPAGGFAIIADTPSKFLADRAGFQGLILDSAFSLNNEGETISINGQSEADSDSLSYLPAWGAKGDGLSLQKTLDGQWISATPTPGLGTTATKSEVAASDKAADEASDVPKSDSPPNLSYSSQLIANTEPDEIELAVTSGRSRLGFVGVPMGFQAKIKKTDNPLSRKDHFWSMGDGSLKYGASIWHAYKFSGDYTVVLNSSSGRSAEAVSITKVKILDPGVSISTANDDYIEILNKSAYELNIGGMVIKTAGKQTTISDDTIISPHASLRLPASSTHLGWLRDFVSLDSPAGDNFSTLKLLDPLILLPDGMAAEDVRRNIINALKNYE